jgi:enamine deaminase RidA (YjgF/YER057c/UK114 family)
VNDFNRGRAIVADSTLWRLPVSGTHHLSGTAGPLTFVGGAGDFDAAGRIRNPRALEKQIDGTIANLAAALDTESCTLDDVVRLKAFVPAGSDEWAAIAGLARHFEADPMPAISTVTETLQPWTGQAIQVQAIAQRGWRNHGDVRVATRPVPEAKRALFKGRPVTGGLRAGEFIALSNRSAADANGVIAKPDDGIAQSHAIMAMHEETLASLGASFQDCVKMEGYYLGTTMEQWAGMAAARAGYFREPAPVATVVPAERLAPTGAVTKIEVMAMREEWNGFDKYIPREDHWPRHVWDWPIPVPYRQAIRLRGTIWLGGQVPFAPGSNSGRWVYPAELTPQTRVTMGYLQDLLRPFGRGLADIKLLVCYFTSDGTASVTDSFVRTIAECMGGALPPMTLVPKEQMHTAENTVEIWGIAQD